MKIQTRPCPQCGKTTILELTSEEWDRWKSGALIQNAMPDRDSTFRELLITGIHNDCWNKIFHRRKHD